MSRATGLRLATAAVLCAVPLGLVWSSTTGYLSSGYFLSGDCGYSAYEFCTPDQFVLGTYRPGFVEHGSQSPARVFLLFAALALLACATRTRTPGTRRVARAAVVSIGIAAVLAASRGASLTLICTVSALVLVGPLVRGRSGPTRGVFVPGATDR